MRKLAIILSSGLVLSLLAVACGDSADTGQDGVGGAGGDGGAGGASSAAGGSDTMGATGGADSSTGGATSMGGQGEEPVTPATGGSASPTPPCTGTVAACDGRAKIDCLAVGCDYGPACTGDAGCEAFDASMSCNQAEGLTCTWGNKCSGTPTACGDYADEAACGAVAGCSWSAP